MDQTCFSTSHRCSTGLGSGEIGAVPEQVLLCVRAHCPAGYASAIRKCRGQEKVYLVHDGVWTGYVCQVSSPFMLGPEVTQQKVAL